MDITNMIKQAQQLQKEIGRIQEELAEQTIEAAAGGGIVKVVANGKQEIISVAIAPEAVDPNDIPMLQDLVLSAVNEALRSSKTMMQQALTKVTGGIRIPGITV